MSGKADADLRSDPYFEALRDWFLQFPERAEEGLVVIRQDMDNKCGVVLIAVPLTAEPLAGCDQSAMLRLATCENPRTMLRLVPDRM